MKYKNGITIDGTFFDVPLVNINITAEFLDKYAERTEAGVLARELIGVYFNYDMTFGVIEDDDLYISLFDKLTEPVEFHTFTLPTSKGTYSFVGYISGIGASVMKIYDTTATFQGLTAKFIAQSPARTPS